MNLVCFLLNRITLLHLSFEKTGTESLTTSTVFLLKEKKTSATRQQIPVVNDWLKKYPKSIPLAIEIKGEGVLRKNCTPSDPLYDRICKGSEFIWEESAETDGSSLLTFIRKEKIALLLQSLEKNRITPILLFFGKEGQREAEENHCIISLLRLQLSFRQLIKPETGNILSRILFHRIKIPLLLLLLLMAIINTSIYRSVSEKYNHSQAVLFRLRQTNKSQAGDDLKLSRFFESHYRSSTTNYSFLADRIALSLPEQIKLTELSFFPLLRPLEKEKPIQILQNTIRIRGETPEVEAISSLTRALKQIYSFDGIILTSLEQERETGKFRFEITITL